MEEKERKDIESSLKLIAKSSSFILIGVIFSKIASYVYRVSIARHFGPEVYGLLTLSLMITGWLVAFSMVGLNSGLYRYIPIFRGKQEIDKIRYLFRASSKFLFLTGVISAIILFFLSEYIAINIFHNEGLIIFLKIFSISIPLSLFVNTFVSITLAYEKASWYSFIFHVLGNSVKILVLFLLILLGLGSNSIVFSHILGLVAMVIALYFLLKFSINEIFQNYSLDEKTKTKTRKELFSYSWPFLFSTIMIYIFYWTDSWMIGSFLNVESVGFYNAAIPIAFLLTIATELFIALLFPLATKEYSKKNFKVAHTLVEHVGKWIFIINLPVLILVFIFSGEIITILFGVEYLVAESALKILSIGFFFSSILTVSKESLNMIGKSKLVLSNIIITAIFNLFLNLLLVPRYGINGAAISTTTSLILLNLAMFIQAKYYLSISPIKRKTIKILLASLIPTTTLFYLVNSINISSYGFWILSSFFALLYILLILITNSLDKNDFTILKSFKKKLLK